jgi:PAS domain S-box-containing protein
MDRPEVRNLNTEVRTPDFLRTEILAALGQKALSSSAASLSHHAAVMVQQALGTCCVGIFEILPGGRELLLREGVGWPREEIGTARVDASVRFHPGYVLSCKEPVVVRDFSTDQRFGTPDLLKRYGMTCGIALGLHSTDRYFGMLGAYAKTTREFSGNDVHFLQAVSYVLAAALEREKAAAGLREREMLLRRVLDANPNIIFVKDRAGKILLANDALAASYGIPVREIVGQSHAELHRRWGMSEEEVRTWLADDAQVINTGTALRMIERFTHRDGTAHWYSTRKLPLSLGMNEACVLIVSADVTEQKNAEDQVRLLNVDLEKRVEERTAALAAANKELEAFSYSISHDLRAPLRAIDGFAQIILEDYGDQLDEEALQLFNQIGRNAQKMGKLIDDLLQFARLARTELQSSTVNMAELVRSVIEELKALEPSWQMQIAVGDLPNARGDAAMLRQVWVNLISNALKFTRGRTVATQIEIAGNYGNDAVTYFVRDNGVGFDMKYAPKLFQVFQRLHRAEEFEGTGVGLAIVQRIVQRHGGQVWAEAKVNEEAVFHFTLPAAD